MQASVKQEELLQSVKSQGLLHPIAVTFVGTILDGRSRVKVCKKLGWKVIPAEIIYFCSWLTAKGETINRSDPRRVEPKPSPLLEKWLEMQIAGRSTKDKA